MRLIPLNQHILRGIIRSGDCVIDATVGGGYDTLFLAHSVGESGRVIGFDIQEQAITQTREALISAGVDARVTLHQCSHEHMALHIPLGLLPRVIMFNLGYLPRGDHAVVTQPESTLCAVKAALELICTGGIVSIMTYPAHEGGEAEYEQLHSYLHALPQKEYTVMHSRCFNASARAPQLWSIQKQG